MKLRYLIPLIVMVFAAAYVVAIPLMSIVFNNNGTVINIVGDITVTIDGEAITDGYALQWGSMYPGESVYAELSITSNYEISCIITITQTDLPTDWTLTWEYDGATCPAQGTLTGDYTLTLPATATAGDHTWGTTITAETIEP